MLELLRNIEASHLSEGGLEEFRIDRFLWCILKPLVLEGVLGEGTVSIVNGKQISYQALSLLTNVRPNAAIHAILASFNSLYDLVISLSVKWWTSREQNIHKDADGPNITALVIVLLQDFGGNVIRCTMHLLQLGFLLIVLD